MAVKSDILRVCDQICALTPGNLKRQDLLVVGSASMVLRGYREQCKDIDVQLPAHAGVLAGGVLPGPYIIGQISIYYHIPAVDVFLDSDIRSSYPSHPESVMCPAHVEFVRRARFLREWDEIDGVGVITPRSYYWLQKLNRQLLQHDTKWSIIPGFSPAWDCEYWDRLGMMQPFPYGLPPAIDNPLFPTGIRKLGVLNQSAALLAPEIRQRIYAAKLALIRKLAAAGCVPQHQFCAYDHHCTPCMGTGYQNGGVRCENCSGDAVVRQRMVRLWCAAGGVESVFHLPAKLVTFPVPGFRGEDSLKPLVVDPIVWSSMEDPETLLGELETLVGELP